MSSTISIDDRVDGQFKIDEDLNKQLAFSDRLGFIRKVYGILSAQLAVTVAFCLCSVLSERFAKFQQEHINLLFFMIVVSLGTSSVLTFFRDIAKTVPTNYALLSAFTIAESYMVSAVCTVYDPQIVLMAAVLTAGVTIALTVYACTTKTDFTFLGGMLFVLACLSLLTGFFLMFSNNDTLRVLYCAVGCVIFSIYLIFDTQIIIGSGRFKLGYDEYIFAAMTLYLDIIVLFLKILEILGKSKK
mmetsp:Transcript_51729/g.59106  ORF Transcript_51729/g.59106 Transcript_51729/m.59106 type:complete len:244 (+) Transcript_51729:77-808(+)|eukprot:CAMPEP_0115008102 /NCGR_PEP_ID=MMETSP0216-20121206/21673_1 /TAXON_ID=223996 /ORGANISM="Protocruzia adherens, Strain Boccale" /LENGTH=243 /DNA_ID=CAMNT_0002375367 /DNA_START=53 /DNA_END=784 /DNA_ORIENTATION=-